MTDWTDNQYALRQHLKHDELSDFLRWSTIEKTMFVGDVDFVHKEYDQLATAYEYNHLVKLIKETSVGNPKTLYGWTSGNLIHQLYHLRQWLDRSDKTVDQLNTIFEIGAGYGAMALICRRLGFKGQYYIEDLPELKQVQGYYLHNTIGLDNIIWRVPGPPGGYEALKCDLLIACHSLGEMALADREALLARVEADGYLFASSYEFGNVDNQAWFMQFAESRPGLQWGFNLHTFQENAFYLVGTGL